MMASESKRNDKYRASRLDLQGRSKARPPLRSYERGA